MKSPNVYLDHAAATPVRREVAAAMAPFARRLFANPSSITAAGKAARKAIDTARDIVADLLGVHAQEVIFTGSGTESANLAICGIMKSFSTGPVRNAAHSAAGGHVITTAIEHHAVLEPIRHLPKPYQATVVSVGTSGVVDPKAIEEAIRPDTRLISVMLANNEIGTIQPVAAIARILAKINRTRQQKKLPRIYLHSDACQAPGYIDLKQALLGVDAITLNAAKVGGPKGVGILVFRSGTPLSPQITGGGQEFGLRSGTENVAGIIGAATALRLAQREAAKESVRVAKLRDQLLDKLHTGLPDIRVNGDLSQRLPNNLNVTISGIEAEPLLLYLDQDGVTIGTGAACNATTLLPSHVLTAIGISETDALCSIRITLGRETTSKNIIYAATRITRRVRWLCTYQQN